MDGKSGCFSQSKSIFHHFKIKGEDKAKFSFRNYQYEKKFIIISPKPVVSCYEEWKTNIYIIFNFQIDDVILEGVLSTTEPEIST